MESQWETQMGNAMEMGFIHRGLTRVSKLDHIIAVRSKSGGGGAMFLRRGSC